MTCIQFTAWKNLSLLHSIQGPHSLLFNEYRGPEHEADHSPPSSTKIKMVELYLNSLHVFMV
jgi:hypothetical protein